MSESLADKPSRQEPSLEGLLLRCRNAYLGSTRREAAEALAACGPAALEALIPALRDPHPEVRAAAAASLGAIGDPAAVEPLCAMVCDWDPKLRRAAAEALGQLGDPRATGPLTEALRRSSFTGSARRQLIVTSLAVVLSVASFSSLLWSLWRADRSVLRLLLPVNLAVVV